MTDLDERFRSLSRTGSPDLWSDIETREPRPGTPPTPWAHRALAAAVAFVIAIAGIGLAAVTFGGAEHPNRTATAVLDGRIAFVGLGEATWDIYTIEPDGAHLLKLTDLTDQVADDPAWSPDGQRIAYVVRESNGASDIWVINADGSGAYVVTTGPGSSWGPTWSPDGSTLAYTRSAPGRADQIWIIDADGSNPRAVTHCDPPECDRDGSPAWSPDGSRIAFVRVSGAGAIIPVSVFVWRLEEAGPKPEQTELEGATWASDLAWSPDGSELAFARSTAAGARFGLWVMGADGSNVRPLGDVAAAQSPTWSPDGLQIAFTAPVGPERASVFVMDADGSGVRRIPGLPEDAISPSWQPVRAAEKPMVPTPSPSPELPLPATAEVVETFEVGQDARSVAYGEGSIWVAVSNNDGSFGGRILRIDPATHEMQAEIAVDAIPSWEVGGGAMVFAHGDLWVAGDLEAPGAYDEPGGGSDAAVVRIDAATNEVVKTFELGGTNAADLVYLDGELWVLVFGDETVDQRMEVVGVDPATGEVGARVPLESGWGHSIVAADGRLIVLESGPGATNAAGQAAVIDPTTNSVSRVDVPSEYVAPMPVIARGDVWISLDPGFIRFDPVAVSFPDPAVPFPAALSGCCGFLEGDDRGMWSIISLDEESVGDRRIILFEPSSRNIVELVDLDDGSPVAMAVAPDSVWILNYEGTLTHVALS